MHCTETASFSIGLFSVSDAITRIRKDDSFRPASGAAEIHGGINCFLFFSGLTKSNSRRYFARTKICSRCAVTSVNGCFVWRAMWLRWSESGMKVTDNGSLGMLAVSFLSLCISKRATSNIYMEIANKTNTAACFLFGVDSLMSPAPLSE